MEPEKVQTFIEKKKEAISKLPYYRGEVPSKNAIRKLPDVNKGEVFWVTADEKPYIVGDKSKKGITLEALDETATISTGMTVYDLNKKMVEKEPVFDWSNEETVKDLGDKLQKWFYETTKDTFYLFYGREIHYVTLVKKNGENTNLLENLKEMIEEFAELVSIDVLEDKEPKLEIWVRTPYNAAELLYFFPYDAGLVEI